MRKALATNGKVWFPPVKMDDRRMAYMSVGLFAGRIYGPVFYIFGLFGLTLAALNLPAGWAAATLLLSIGIIGLGVASTAGYFMLHRYSCKYHPKEWEFMRLLFSTHYSLKSEARRLLRLK